MSILRSYRCFALVLLLLCSEVIAQELPGPLQYTYGERTIKLASDTEVAVVLLRQDVDGADRELTAIIASDEAWDVSRPLEPLHYPRLHRLHFRSGLDEGQRRSAIERLNREPSVEFASPLLLWDRAWLIPRPEVLLVLDGESSNRVLGDLLRRSDLRFLREFPALSPTFLLAYSRSPLATFELCEELSRLPGVTCAQPNFILKLPEHATIPNDPLFGSQWNLQNTGQFGGTPGADMNLPDAWDFTTGVSSIRVAVLDEGVDVNHEDLAANLQPGHDSVTASPTPGGIPGNCDPGDPHGTCCAGIIGAVGNNGVGISGIGWNIGLVPIRIGFGNWWTQEDWIIDGITWAADNGVDVLSNSYGGGSPSTLEENAIDYASTVGRGGLGCTVFFSSGNGDVGTVSYPAAYPNSIAVGATSPCDERKSANSCDGEWWWGSQWGSALDIVAPGPLVTSTDITGSAGYSTGNYAGFSGTSSACPHAAGAAGLILSVNPGLTHEQVKDYLQQGAADGVGTPSEDTPGWDQFMGWGRIDVHASLALASGGLTGPFGMTCSSSGGGAQLGWTNGDIYDSIEVARNGTVIATLAGTAISYLDSAPGVGNITYHVRGYTSGAPTPAASCSIFLSGGATDLVWAPTNASGAVAGGIALATALSANGREVVTLPTLTGAGDLNLFSAIWVNLGIYPENHILVSSEATLLEQFLIDGNGGSTLYLEGGDTWFFDPAYSLHSLFGVIAVADGTGDLGTVLGSGQTSCDLSSMSFSYSGENAWIDHLLPEVGATTILSNASPAYNVAIFNESPGHSTIGASLEFGGLDDGSSTKAQLLGAMLSCLFGGPIAPPPLASLTCLEITGNIQLAWVLPTSYDLIEVYRNGALLTTLAGAATNYLDSSPLPGGNNYDLYGVVGTTPSDPASCLIDIALPENVLFAGDYQAGPGSIVDVRPTANHELDLEAYSFGVTFDPTLLQVEELTLEGTYLGVGGADFFAPAQNNAEGYFTVGLVVDITPPITEVISAGDGNVLLNARMQVSPSAPVGSSTLLDLPEVTGAFGVETVFVENSGVAFSPARIPGSVGFVDTLDLMLTATDIESAAGGSVNHYVLLDNEIDIAGWSFGVDLDGALLTVLSVDLEGTDAGDLGVEFFAPGYSNGAAEGWYTVGAVVDLSPPLDTVLPAGEGWTIIHALLAVSAGALEGETSPMAITDQVGNPPVSVILADPSGNSFIPQTTDGLFTVIIGGTFIRGDVNIDGKVQISDPINLLDHLFADGSIGCSDSSDANDDGSVDLADSIFILGYLFSNGPQPPPPFTAPGSDPTDDSLGCDQSL